MTLLKKTDSFPVKKLGWSRPIRAIEEYIMVNKNQNCKIFNFESCSFSQIGQRELKAK